MLSTARHTPRAHCVVSGFVVSLAKTHRRTSLSPMCNGGLLVKDRLAAQVAYPSSKIRTSFRSPKLGRLQKARGCSLQFVSSMTCLRALDEAKGKEAHPEGPSTQYFMTLVPKAIKGMVFGIRLLKY